MKEAPSFTEYDGFELKNKDWFKHITRDVSLIIIFYTESAYIFHFKTLGAIPLDEIIYECNNGVLSIWRPEGSFKRIVESIQKRFRKDPNWVLDRLRKLKEIEDKTEKFCKTPLKRMNDGEKIDFLTRMDGVFEDYLTNYMFLVCFGYGFKEEDKLRFKEISGLYEGLKQSTKFRIMERKYIDFGKPLFGKNGEFVTYLTFDELKDMIRDSKLDISLAKRRFERCIFYGAPKGRYILTGKDADAVYEKLMKNRKKESSCGDIKGVPACQGKVTGKVFVAITEKDYKNIDKDVILVTPATTPWLIPYVGKVKGIVADEGGLGSHAAILARERKIPCVVGTRNATEKLKTGDLVEVDADNGIVRKIK